jgi:hypothetical protein
MPQRQRVLMLWTTHPMLTSDVVAWSTYDPKRPSTTGQDDEPPYKTVMDAMNDGWRVVQFARPQPLVAGHEFDTTFLKHEYVLEQIEEIAHV